MKKTLKFALIGILITLIIMGLIAFKEPKDSTPVLYKVRYTSEIRQEKVAAEAWLRWLYQNPVGKITLNGLAKRKMMFNFYGRLMDKRNSVKKIQPFVDMFNIDMSEYNRNIYQYSSFNDFFTRKIKKSARPIDTLENSIISPADGKITVFDNINDTNQFLIKGIVFSLEALLKDKKLAEYYQNGSMAIIRLAPSDYHRFHFPVSGEAEKTKRINGKYYSVSPIALRENLKIFYQNKREYTIIHSTKSKQVLFMEVGATMVGTIVQSYTPYEPFDKGEEKGYFKFGGSTVIVLFKKDTIRFDEDLVQNSAEGYETKVKMGERIALISGEK